MGQGNLVFGMRLQVWCLVRLPETKQCLNSFGLPSSEKSILADILCGMCLIANISSGMLGHGYIVWHLFDCRCHVGQLYLQCFRCSRRQVHRGKIPPCKGKPTSAQFCCITLFHAIACSSCSPSDPEVPLSMV